MVSWVKEGEISDNGGREGQSEKKQRRLPLKTCPQSDEMCNLLYKSQLKWNFENNSSNERGKQIRTR